MSGIVQDPPAAPGPATPGTRRPAGNRSAAGTRGAAGIDPGRLSGAGRSVAAPLLLGAAALLLWQGAVWLRQIEPFVVPGPLAIAGAFADNFTNVLGAAAVTGVNAAVGLDRKSTRLNSSHWE